MNIKASALNFDKICRTCFTERGKMQPLFECSIASMLMSFTSVQVRKDDGLPSNICLQCLRQINRAVSFKNQCEQSDTKLHEILNKQKFCDQIITEIQLDSTTTDELTNISNEISNDYQGLNLGKALSPSSENNYIDTCNNEDDTGSDGNINTFFENPGESLADDRNLWDPVKKQCEPANVGKPHKCFVCHEEFFERCQLTAHMNNHTTKIFSNVCDTCGNKFSSLHSLKRHQKLVHSADRPYVCQVCGNGFLFEGGLKIHLRRHRDERPFACPAVNCGKKFIRRQVLKVHMRLHSGEKNYVCRYCDKRFTQSTSLKVHEKIHTGDRPHLCSLCAMRFIQPSHLKVHMQRHHSLEKPQMRTKCIVCEKPFRGSYELKVHMRKHTGDRPFGCDVCQQKFSTKKGLQRHMLVHSDTRKHGCTICNKAFKTAKTLKIHIRTHTGERPYSCDICGQRFAQSATRNSHLKTHNVNFVGVKEGVENASIIDNNLSSAHSLQTIQIDNSITY